MDLNAPIYVAGHRGLIGSAIVRKLKSLGYKNLILKTRYELDLTDMAATMSFFKSYRPEYVFMAAAKVGSVLSVQTHPTTYLLENLALQNNIFTAAQRHGVKKLLYFGSSAVYPDDSKQPIKETSLLTGSISKANEAYAIAKIAGIKTAEAFNIEFGTRFVSVIPTNTFGPNDSCNPDVARVIPSMIGRLSAAKDSADQTVRFMGSGTQRREFIYVDDLADACVHVMKHYEGLDPLNIGVGSDISIRELADLLVEQLGYRGVIEWDTTKPEGSHRKLLDSTGLANLGWHPKTSLQEGLQRTILWYLSTVNGLSKGLPESEHSRNIRVR